MIDHSSSRLSVVITAGASGIGRAIAAEFCGSGADVAVCDIDGNAVNLIRREMPKIMAEVVDVADEKQVQDFVAKVIEKKGSINVAVNNAGIAGACNPIEKISSVDLAKSFSVNVYSAFYVTSAVIPSMKAMGGGAIVNISTCSAATLPIGRADYIASKWAIEGLTRASARELGIHNIRVNAIRPGMINNDRMISILTKIAEQEGETIQNIEAKFLNYISMRSKIQPEEIGRMAVFLSSPASCHITGQIIAVDGNMEWER